MKKLLFLIIAILIISITSCENSSEPIINKESISFFKTTLGGCHNEELSNSKSITEDYTDTIEFSIINEDTLNVFIGINYTCCAPFISETKVVNDTLIMEISDTCSLIYETCYCKCDCYYTWDFQFIDFEEKEYNFIVKLNDPREETILIFKQGIIDLSK